MHGDVWKKTIRIPLQQALIDSGAADNFMDAAIAGALQISLLYKAMSEMIETSNGSLLSLVVEDPSCGGPHPSGGVIQGHTEKYYNLA